MTSNVLAGTDGGEAELVIRSEVTLGLPYRQYRQTLRYDFFHSCAYCTMSEAEATAVRFTIDHYEPRSSSPELENEYSNLMYACDECNIRKGPRVVPDEAQKDGIRFFRPDVDKFTEHFIRAGIRLNGLSKLADYTIDAVDLNRLSLRRLRELRQRFTKCEEMILGGIRLLAKFRVDQLPPDIRKSAMLAVQQLNDMHDTAASAIAEILRQHAKSPLSGEDPDFSADQRLRNQRLKGTESLYPNAVWRAPRD